MTTTKANRTSTFAVLAYLLIGLLIASSLTSCTDASMARVVSLGDTISMVNCDGSITHTWTSTGKVQSSTHSDGYYFTDAATGFRLYVSGNVIITRVNQ
jgi:hypothetical protein